MPPTMSEAFSKYPLKGFVTKDLNYRSSIKIFREGKMLRVPAIRFEQHGRKMFVTVLEASWIAEALETGRLKVDVWKPNNPDGYQREHSKTRSKEYARFIAAKNISPPSILLSIRGADGDRVTYKDNYLMIPDDVTLYLVDGQHRAWGFYYCQRNMEANLDNFTIPTVVMLADDKYEEAKQFVIINKTQKGVRTDLAERFLQQAALKEGYTKIMEDVASGALPRKIFADIEWRPKAVEIADILNNDSNSPWFGRIRPPNVSQPGATVRQKSFTDSLEPILKHPDFKDLDTETLAKVLNNYWKAIRDLMPEAFTSPKDYVTQKTTGVFVFHGLLPTIAKYCKDPETGVYVLTYGRLRDILSKLRDSEYLQAEAWRASRRGIPGGKVALMGTSQKTFKTLRSILEKELEDRMEREEIVRRRVQV
ncbi:MAG: DGQHR domain-containing protein [Candidatus Freyarchaeota archaeon]